MAEDAPLLGVVIPIGSSGVAEMPGRAAGAKDRGDKTQVPIRASAL
jgi:hypothetical protein